MLELYVAISVTLKEDVCKAVYDVCQEVYNCKTYVVFVC